MTPLSKRGRGVCSSRRYGPWLSRWTTFTPTRLRRTPRSWGRSMALEIVKPGLSTTVQDLGRPGYYHLGIPESGGMDRYSLVAANLLVGNPAGAAVLEVVFQGPEIRFSRDYVIAVCGAEMPPKVDGAEQPGWTSFPVKAGQTLSFGYLKSGARAYI